MNYICVFVSVLAAGCTVDAATTNQAPTATTTEAVTTCATTTDYNNDPLNCGTCGNVCDSGLCYAGVCADDRAGHLFVNGNSFRRSNPSWDRILGNEIFLREQAKVSVALYAGTAPSDINNGTGNAMYRASQLLHRGYGRTLITNSAAVQPALATADVFIVEAQPQLDDVALQSLASEWNLALDDFTRRGGVVIVLDAPSTKNHGTMQVLGSLMPMTRAASLGTLGSVAATGDQSVGRVPLTFALADSVGYATAAGQIAGAVSDADAVLVAHRTVQ